MSVKVRFLSSGDVGTMGRSSSFAGFSSVQSRKISKSLHRNSMRSKMPMKSSKVYATLRKGTPCLDPKPQQVKRIFEALKKGLKEYLCVQQAELDYLSGRHKDTRRNSRLAFYYDLDKQTRSVERHIRKMEFHISKVEELYEGYCIQCRLRDGASNMQQAFALSPLTKASRESLVELYRNLQECTEDMCLIEGALEVHLGEFHVKMKGLVGYARLCPGDQYEVFIRLGRQRWKLKGKIEADDSQTWDEEEKVFIPTLHERFEIKVMELRGLSTLLVGTVTCELEDFFTTRPQTIVVDITELGTIKLQLEVTWNPFDTESFFVSPGIGRFSVGSRKGSLYNWTPPNTPSFREKYYLSLFQQPQQGREGQRNSTPTHSLLSYLSDSDLGMHLPGKSAEQPEMTEVDSFSSDDPRETETGTSASTSDAGFPPFVPCPDVSIEEEQQEPSAPCSDGLKPETSQRAGHWHVAHPSRLDFGASDPVEPLGPNLLREGVMFDSHQSLGKVGKAKTEQLTDGMSQSVEKPLQEVLDLLKVMNPRETQLRELEYHVLCFRDRLKPKVANKEHSSMESLMETILESFDFLNADFNSDELSLFGSSQAHSINNDDTSQSLKTSTKELTAGIHELDVLLVVHLHVCKALLQKLMCPNLSRLVQESLLEEVVQQKEVLEKLSILDVEKVRNATSADELIPQVKKKKRYLKMWSECTEPGGILFCSAKQFQNQLKKTFLHKIKGKYPGQLEIVCHRLLEQVVSCSGLVSSVGLSEELLTWFQFQRYLEKQNVTDLEKHFAQLTKEVTLLEDLQCAGRLKKIKKLKGKKLGQLQPLPQTLKTWALLQLDENHRVRKAAIARLSDAAGNRSFREKALLFYTSTLSDSDAKLQQASCLALKYLKGMESIDQIASLCQSDLEDVRTAARETTLSFGEKGRLAFEKMDRICSEVRETLCQEADIEITVF
ncbi:RIPOR family member 3 isoform X1 [Dromiciops gliroides]|uniref:RIPOR family member 3 isoform X1 n=2 Tax=Dromiciops gliroides TaxID=33562 RepID=UPI001CC5B3D6|nr:RIPOR family member 3 isoform X1 [Dromiciops gliroides]XP_043837463.1 RIPOR family member 3 isoform X1 [Dromiciops gliroides]XP_043837464.1 RIPOR family member 3 isoform X1 [Dromiciops gliroides]XP_043837465.1 RIPOR family member 3 isoform X1 [Dromiciops gliroides]